MILVIVGLLMLALYQLLKTLEIGSIGAPTDIGGGLIPLIGFILLGVGLIRLFIDFLRARGRHRDH